LHLQKEDFEKVQHIMSIKECLAQKLFVSPPVIANWEHERSYPNIQQVLALSEFFGKSTDYLLKD
ncbi:MAG: helix-turn-helix domain-containing protein, partial [Pseudolactococcus laudensis]